MFKSLNKSGELYKLTFTSYTPQNDAIESLKHSLNLVSMYISTIVILVGLVGHFLTIFVFAQKRFRKNSSNVYFFCLAINDSVYLLVHFLKEPLKNYSEIYLTTHNQHQQNQYINMDNSLTLLNLVDRFDLGCRLINYLRYVLRLISSYIIVSITFQRLSLVYKPLSNRFKSKKSAWLNVICIVLVSLLINIWVMFVLEIRQDTTQEKKHCDVKSGFDKIYFYITIAYVCIKMLIPVLLIFVSNLIIMFNLVHIHSNKFKLRENHSVRKNFSKKVILNKEVFFKQKNQSRLRPFYLTINQVISRVTKRANNSKILTKLIILISFSYILFNLPYFVIWSMFYYNEMLLVEDLTNITRWFVAFRIAEIFYLLNYAVSFYIYCASGSVFRNQLKYSSKKLTIFLAYLVIQFYMIRIDRFLFYIIL